MFQAVEKCQTPGPSPGPSPGRMTASPGARLAAFGVLLLLASHSPKVIASELSDSVHLCAQESDDAKRLACYDNAAGRAPPLAGASSHPAAKADQRPAAPLPTPPRATEITATITHTTRRADGRYVITLDNGQIWSEAQTKERLSVNTGDLVTIRTEPLGAHYLRTPSGADVRVTHQP